MDAIPVCPRPVIVRGSEDGSNPNELRVVRDVHQLVVNTRLAQRAPLSSRATVAREHLRATCVSVGVSVDDFLARYHRLHPDLVLDASPIEVDDLEDAENGGEGDVVMGE